MSNKYNEVPQGREARPTRVCIKHYSGVHFEVRNDCTPLCTKIVQSYVRPFRSLAQCRESLCSFFPIFQWFPRYSPKVQLSGDISGGIMSGILNITQGLAYAILAGVPAVNGLYATCFSALLYPFVSSWPHGTMGPFAIIQMMCGTVARSVMERYHHSNRTMDPEILEQVTPETIISALTLTMGLICIGCAMLHMQFLAEYFSEPLVGGFLCGATFHILIQQLDSLIGVHKPKSFGFFRLFKDLYYIWTLIPMANITSCIISGFSLLFLFIFKVFLHPQLERKYKKKLNVPYELILVITTTFVCYQMQLDTKNGVQTVGEIPRGLPIPAIPQIWLITEIFWDALAIVIVQGAIHMSMIKVLSHRMGYTVDDNQEIYAVGFVLSLASFLPVFPTTNALSRPTILVECGATSQIANFVSFTILLTVLLAAGPLFFWLPMPVLGAVIVMSLRNLFIRGYEEMIRYWKLSQWDFAIWMITFLATVLDDVICGLAIGISFEMLSIVLRTQGPRWNAQFVKKENSTDICVFTFEAMLLFTNSERFKSAIARAVEVWDAELESDERRDGPRKDAAIGIFIMDCSAMVEVDSVGAMAMKLVLEEMKAANIDVYFVKPSLMLMQTLAKEGTRINTRFIFGAVDEALRFSRTPQKSVSVSMAMLRNLENPERDLVTRQQCVNMKKFKLTRLMDSVDKKDSTATLSTKDDSTISSKPDGTP